MIQEAVHASVQSRPREKKKKERHLLSQARLNTGLQVSGEQGTLEIDLGQQQANTATLNGSNMEEQEAQPSNGSGPSQKPQVSLRQAQRLATLARRRRTSEVTEPASPLNLMDLEAGLPDGVSETISMSTTQKEEKPGTDYPLEPQIPEIPAQEAEEAQLNTETAQAYNLTEVQQLEKPQQAEKDQEPEPELEEEIQNEILSQEEIQLARQQASIIAEKMLEQIESGQLSLTPEEAAFVEDHSLKELVFQRLLEDMRRKKLEEQESYMRSVLGFLAQASRAAGGNGQSQASFPEAVSTSGVIAQSTTRSLRPFGIPWSIENSTAIAMGSSSVPVQESLDYGAMEDWYRSQEEGEEDGEGAFTGALRSLYLMCRELMASAKARSEKEEDEEETEKTEKLPEKEDITKEPGLQKEEETEREKSESEKVEAGSEKNVFEQMDKEAEKPDLPVEELELEPKLPKTEEEVAEKTPVLESEPMESAPEPAEPAPEPVESAPEPVEPAPAPEPALEGPASAEPISAPEPAPAATA